MRQILYLVVRSQMIQQHFLPLNFKQKSMYIIQLQQLRLQKTQGRREDCDLLKYFITVMIRRRSKICPWNIPYILFIFVCVRRATCISSTIVVFMLQNHNCPTEKNCLYIQNNFKNEKLLYGNLYIIIQPQMVLPRQPGIVYDKYHDQGLLNSMGCIPFATTQY